MVTIPHTVPSAHPSLEILVALLVLEAPEVQDDFCQVQVWGRGDQVGQMGLWVLDLPALLSVCALCDSGKQQSSWTYSITISLSE